MWYGGRNSDVPIYVGHVHVCVACGWVLRESLVGVGSVYEVYERVYTLEFT